MPALSDCSSEQNKQGHACAHYLEHVASIDSLTHSSTSIYLLSQMHPHQSTRSLTHSLAQVIRDLRLVIRHSLFLELFWAMSGPHAHICTAQTHTDMHTQILTHVTNTCIHKYLHMLQTHAYTNTYTCYKHMHLSLCITTEMTVCCPLLNHPHLLHLIRTHTHPPPQVCSSW